MLERNVMFSSTALITCKQKTEISFKIQPESFSQVTKKIKKRFKHQSN